MRTALFADIHANREAFDACLTAAAGHGAEAYVFLGDIVGQVFALLVLTVAAAEAAIGLAVLVVYFRNRGSIAVEDVNLMKG